MYKVFNNYSLSESSITTYERIEDAINPLNNTGWQLGNRFISKPTFKQFILKMFSPEMVKEDLLSSTQRYASSKYSTMEEKIIPLLEEFDNQSGLEFSVFSILPFLRPHFHSNSFRINRVTFKTKSGMWVGTYNEAVVLKRTEDNQDFFKPLAEAINSLLVSIEEMPDSIEVTDSIRSYVSSFVLNHKCGMLLWYYTDSIFLRKKNQDIVRPSDAYKSLKDSGIERATVTISDLGIYLEEIHITLKYEVTEEVLRQEISHVFGYNTRVQNVVDKVIRFEDEYLPTYLGIELELTTQYTVPELVKAQPEVFFICKEDSSITGSMRNRYELVTVPCTIKAHKQLWAQFFSKLDYEKFDVSKETTNGMHVHISLKEFQDDNHLRNFSWFIDNEIFSPFNHMISERKEGETQYCKYWRVPNGQTLLETYKRYRGPASSRGAVTKSRGTVEVRIFKGLVSYACVIKNLEFIDSLIEYTRFIPYQRCNPYDYYVWLMKTKKNQYSTLKQFLTDETEVEEMFDKITIDVIIKTFQTNLELLERRLMAYQKTKKIPDNLLNFINKQLGGKNTFCIKDGLIQLTHSVGSKVRKYDRIVQDKITRYNKPLSKQSFSSISSS